MSSNDIEDHLNKRWAETWGKYQGHRGTNVYGLTPIEIARINMETEKARIEFERASVEVEKYVRENVEQ